MADKRSPEKLSVTRRLQDNSMGVTRRLEPNGLDIMEQDAGVTKVLDLPLPPTQSNLLPPGTLVNERYRVEKGPIGEQTGESRVYRCHDTQTSETVVLKVYHTHLSPKSKVLEELLNLNHPHLVCLLDFGVWDRNFYEVQEYCRGGSVKDLAPLPEKGVRPLLSAILKGLKYCHDSGIVHRDIKPNNLLFRDPGKKELVIGDFGISSFLEDGESEKKTRTFMFFSVDYCSPEQLRLREVGPPSDYYSLGITLVHLLTGTSPFQGLSDDEIVDRHLRGPVPVPGYISANTSRLLRGLTRSNPKTRWGYNQAMAWLKGKTVLTDEGLQDRDDPYEGLDIGYPEYTAAKNPAELARALDKQLFDASKEFTRGRISPWVKLFDPDLADRVEALEQTHVKDPELGLAKLRFLLDPTLPLRFETCHIKTPEQLEGLIALDKSRFPDGLKQAFLKTLVAYWLEARDPGGLGGERSAAIQAFLHTNPDREHIWDKALLWIMNPSAPCVLSKGVELRTPDDIPAVAFSNPEAREALEKGLFGGVFTAWMELAYPDNTEAIEFVRKCRLDYAKHRWSGVMSLCWFIDPSRPFLFQGEAFKQPANLASRLLRDKDAWDQGKKLLKDKTIAAWLTATGMLRDSQPMDDIMQNTRFSWDAKLDMCLRLMAPDLSRPKLDADCKKLDFGLLRPGLEYSDNVAFVNRGKGHLYGRVALKGASHDVDIDPAFIDGPLTQITVTVRPPRYLQPGLSAEVSLLAETNGGSLEIPIHYSVKEREPRFTVNPATALDKLKQRFGKWKK